MSPEAIGGLLAPVNAGLNFTSLCFLIAGLIFIKRRDAHRHRIAMMGAVTASGLFLVFYLTRASLTGTHRFAGEGLAKVVYLSVLFSHMILAVVIVPLILRLLYLIWKRRFHSHARLARWAYPIWLYVSATGLIVYAMLYHLYGWV